MIRSPLKAMFRLAVLAVAICGIVAGPAAAARPQLLWQVPPSGEPGSGGGQLHGPRGIATDPSTGHVFVADSENSRIDEFTAWGEFVKTWGWGVVASGPDDKPGPNERQKIAIGAASGHFSLAYLNTSGVGAHTQTTSAIAFNASAATVQAALEALESIGPGDVAVSGPGGGPWNIEFTGAYKDADVLPLEIVESTLSGGAETTTVETIQDGGSFEACIAANGDVCQAGQAGYLAGEMFNPLGVAVDGEGNVYVDELVSEGSEPSFRVQKFDSEGNFELMIGGEVNKTSKENVCTKAQLEGGDVCGSGVPGVADGQFAATNQFLSHAISIGPSGDLFVGDLERIQEFEPDGHFKAEVKVPGERIRSLEVDGTGNFFVTFGVGDTFIFKNNVRKLNAVGATVSEFPVENPRDLALDSDGRLYVSEGHFGVLVGERPRVDIFDVNGTKLLPTKEEEEEAKELSEKGEAVEFFAEATKGGELPGLAASSACGIAGSDLYVSKFNNGASSPRESAVRAYGPSPDPSICPPPKAAPTIAAQYATSVDPDGATVKANINPHFWVDTAYYVEYGTGKCSEGGCTSRQPVAAESKLTSQVSGLPVTSAGVFIGNLQPKTTYHYRFVAKSGGGGPSVGVGEAHTEATFTTPALPTQPPSPDPCTNASVRYGAGAFLPDCRGYEMVSPDEKNNVDIVSLGTSVGLHAALDQSASSGEALTYSAYGSFGDVKGAPYTSQYMATRGEGGWSTDPISPARGLNITGSLVSEYQQFTSDLCSGWLAHDSDPVLAEGAIEGFGNLYRRDEAREGCPAEGEGFEALTTVKPQEGQPEDYFSYLQGTSADGQVAAFLANDKLTANAAPRAEQPGGSAKYQCYEATAGKVKLISVLPSGLASKSDCRVGTGSGISLQESLHNAVSEDGSHIFWTAALESGRVYLRLNGKNPTVAVSEEGEALSGKTNASRFLTAAADGSKAIYAVGNLENGGDLYEFDSQSKASTLIAHKVMGILGASEDASRVYLVSEEGLDGAPAGSPNLYLYDASGGGGLRFVAVLSDGDLSQSGFFHSPVHLEPSFHTARVSPDGLSATFTSAGSPTGYDNTDANSGKPDAEVYVYDANAEGGEGKLACVSCNPTNARPAGSELEILAHQSGTWAAAQIPTWPTQLYASRPLSADGNRLFFESFESLVPRDSNGAQDVYEWEAPGTGSCEESSTSYSPPNGGCLFLISSGQSPTGSEFIDASTDGRDVFFTTAQSLVGQDSGLIDVYDARAGGGFPAPTTPPVSCEGEACQSPPAPPDDPTAASASFEGAGNVIGVPAKKKHTKHAHKKRHKKARHAGHKRQRRNSR